MVEFSNKSQQKLVPDLRDIPVEQKRAPVKPVSGDLCRYFSLFLAARVPRRDCFLQIPKIQHISCPVRVYPIKSFFSLTSV